MILIHDIRFKAVGKAGCGWLIARCPQDNLFIIDSRIEKLSVSLLLAAISHILFHSLVSTAKRYMSLIFTPHAPNLDTSLVSLYSRI